MLFNVTVTTKNKNSLIRFLLFLNNQLNKKHSFNFFLSSSKTFLTLKKKITVLKSPHVNKKSKEKFQFVYFKFSFNFYSDDEKKDLFLLKKLKTFLFSDLKLQIKTDISYKRNSKNLKVNPNNFKNFFHKKSVIMTVFDSFGENCFSFKKSLNSSVGRAKD